MSEYQWSRIDQSANRAFLSEDDICYRYYSYTPRQGFSWSTGNDLIINLKITPSDIKKNPNRKTHKDGAIKQFASDLCSLLGSLQMNGKKIDARSVLLVPIPCSKDESDPDYDDRLVRVCSKVSSEHGYNVCEDFRIKETYLSAHNGGSRDPKLRASNYRLDAVVPGIRLIIVVDDVITTGCSFKAVKDVLSEVYSSELIVGVFWAISVYDT